MSRRDWTMTVELAVRTWAPKVTEAALGFEARFTRRALRVHKPKLADVFEVVLADYEAAVNTGSATEIINAGTRLCRAYAVITAELQAAHAPEDAYMIGRDPDTGAEIIIASVPAAAERAREQGHRFAKWFSPDEIATIIGLDARAKKIADVKAFFPGAEIIGVTRDGDADQE
jgi:hypothetical protein